MTPQIPGLFFFLLLINYVAIEQHGWSVATVPCHACPRALGSAHNAHVVLVAACAIHLSYALGIGHARGRARWTLLALSCRDTMLTIMTEGRNSLSRHRILFRDRDSSLLGQTVSRHQTLSRHRANRALS